MIAAAALLAVCAATRVSEACSCAGMDNGIDVPSGMPLPADARGALHTTTSWWVIATGTTLGAPRVNVPSVDDYAIETLDGTAIPHAIDVLKEPAPWGGGGEVAYGILVRALSPLAPGKYRFRRPGGYTYKLVDKSGKERTAHTGVRIVEIGTVAVDPKAEIRLAMSPPTRAELEVAAGMSCSAKADAVQQSIEVKLPKSIEAIKAALMFETIVDGKPWRPAKSICTPTTPGDSWQGKGRDIVYTLCKKDIAARNTGVSAGAEHWVQVRVHAPGSQTVLETARKAFTLRCPAEPKSLPKPQKAKPKARVRRGCGNCAVGPAPAAPWSWIAGAVGVLALRRRRKPKG